MRTPILLATLVSMLLMSFAAARVPKTADGAHDGSSVEKAVLVRGGLKAERAWMLEHLHYAPHINYEHATIVRKGRIFSYYSFSTPMGSTAKYISTRAITSDASRFQSLTPRNETCFDLYLMLTDLTRRWSQPRTVRMPRFLCK